MVRVSLSGDTLDMITSTQITPDLGSEMTPNHQLIDFDDDQVAHLKVLAAQRGIVVARGQTMNVEQQAAFAHRLGEPLTTPMNGAEVPPELIVIKADENSKRAAGQGWHSDVSSEEEPPGLSMLRMEVVPSAGGDTLFADMYAAFASLSPALQTFVQTLTARHDPVGHYLYLSGAKRLDELPYATHPVVRIHPDTGRKALYVNAGFVSRIVELNRRESAALLQLLYDHVAYSANIQCRVAWQPGTVVFWDNRCVQHFAAFDYFPQQRLGYRATIRGEKPIAADLPIA